MKKIIYSLVIMIAAGSLFTSCIEQVEPLGIQDLRYAKAEYIRALKDLRAADAEYRRAEAAVQQAIARYEDALTAGVNADTEYQKLLNEYQALVNQDYAGEIALNEVERLAAIDSIQKLLELREYEHKTNLAKAEKEMRLAQEDLRVTIRNINLACGDLTANEKVAIYEAAAVYYWLTEKSILYKDSVFQAQQKVDTLKQYKERFSDTAWCPGTQSLVKVYEQIEHEIQIEYAKIDFWMDQYENLPDTAAAIAQWKEYLDAFDEEIDQIALDTAKLNADKAALTALLKEGVRDFDVAVAEWIEENWYTEDGKIFEEPATSAGPKPTEAQYTSKTADSLKVLMIKPKNIDPAAWEKFKYLLKSYETVEFPFSKETPKNKVVAISTSGDTVTVIIRQDMKEYILGAAGNKEGSQKYEYTVTENKKKVTKNLPDADYGLLGVYDILERDYVVSETAKPTEKKIKEAKEAMEKAEAKWVKDSTILTDGVEAFKTFTDGEQALKDQIDENGKGAKKMVTAIVDLQNAFKATGTLIKSFDGNDSTKLFNALVEFAQAREDYLDFSTSVKTVDPQDPTKRDSTVFYYSQGKSGAGKPIFASKKFTALTEKEMKAGEYEYTTDDPGDVKFVTTVSGAALNPDSLVNAFANVVDQLASELSVIFVMNGDPAKDTIDFSKYVPGTKPLLTGMYGKYYVDSWTKPTKIMNADGTDYVPADLVAAKKNFVDSINAYVQAYRDFWGFDDTEIPDFTTSTTEVAAYIAALESGKAADIKTTRANLVKAIKAVCKDNPYDPTCYARSTFHPYSEAYPIVYFAADTVMATSALSAVMNSVDPTMKGKGDNWLVGKKVESNTAILRVNGTVSTDFYKFMKAAWNYYILSNKDASQNLAKIRAEIKKVEDALAADEAQAGILDKDKYEAAVAYWEILDAYAKAYYKAKVEFVGIYDYDAKGNPIWNPIFANVATSTSGVDTCEQGKTAWLKAAGVEALFAKNIIGLYAGWNEHLAAGQLELAIELFGEEPWEVFNEYQLEKDQKAEEIAELKKLKPLAEEVYKAKAKIAGFYDSQTVSAGDNIETLYNKYAAAYKALQDAIVVFDEFGNVDPTNTSAKVNKAYATIDGLANYAAAFKSDVPDWDGLISKAENELEVLKNRQKTINHALSVAKENYDRLREYLLSQDGVSYVIPVSTADIDDVISNLNHLLLQFGKTAADVAAEVAPYIGE